MSDATADNLDHASEVEQAFRERAIENARKALKPPPEFDGKHCVECDDEIPKERLVLVKFTCIGCQSRIEKTALFRR